MRATPPLPLALPDAVVRTFDTPDFAGMTFYEIRAKSLINRVPGPSRVSFESKFRVARGRAVSDPQAPASRNFEWTINPYRGCVHACTYCFARNTHTYLDLDAGHDFDTKVIVKVNAGPLLRRELAAPRWSGAHIAMGTNVDCYQRAEGRYRLMREVIAALRDFANPFSILTKGTLITRDLDLLRQAAGVTTVGLALSIGFIDETLWRSVEPGTPSPRRRLDTVRRLSDAGFAVSVLMAPVLPGLTDGAEAIDETVREIARAGAASITPISLHLRSGAREWYLTWLAREHRDLLPRYRELYGRGAYLDGEYQREISARVRQAARRYGITPTSEPRPAEPTRPAHEQLTLL